jgi:cytochrome c oxidase assembly factor 4
VLYKRILGAARAFPSIKRDKLVEEIRTEFRANANEADGPRMQEQLGVAYKGLEQLSMYSGLKSNRGDWAVSLETNPMPKPPSDGDEDNDITVAGGR